jgi:hypothetical protein
MASGPKEPQESPLPLAQLRFVKEEWLRQRLEEVKVLYRDENELYRLVKDSSTGEYFLHYAVRHLNLTAGAAEEEYHHLLPLEHDEVISFALGSPFYRYPDEWQAPYLRNGSEGGYVWYDPNGAAPDIAAYEEAAAALKEKLLAFRREGSLGEEEIRRLLEETERLFPPKAPDEK